MSNSTPPTLGGHEEKHGAEPGGGIKLPSIAFLSNQKNGFLPIGSPDQPYPPVDNHRHKPPLQPVSRPISTGLNPGDQNPSASGTPPSMIVPKPHESDAHNSPHAYGTSPSSGHFHGDKSPHVHRSLDPQHTNNPHHHHHVRKVSGGPHGHHHHHHHHHHRRQHSNQSQPQEEQPVAEKEAAAEAEAEAQNGAIEEKANGKPETEVVKNEKTAPYVLNKGPLNELLREVYPKRKHIGSIVYNPTTTWESLQIDTLRIDEHHRKQLHEIQQKYVERCGESYHSADKEYIPCLPPLTEAYVNCFVEVKIPYKYIKEFLEKCNNEQVQRKRELWGGAGGIYTDDSDILAVLKHLGIFDNNADLTDIKENWKKEEIVKPLVVHKDADGVDLLDLSVTLLILPTLKQYYGFYKNGLNSRSWLGEEPHSGLSLGVWGVKWETYNSYAGDKAIRKRAQREFEDDREVQRSIIENGRGWRFDSKCYRKLKNKFTKLSEDKKQPAGKSH